MTGVTIPAHSMYPHLIPRVFEMSICLVRTVLGLSSMCISADVVKLVKPYDASQIKIMTVIESSLVNELRLSTKSLNPDCISSILIERESRMNCICV